MRRRSRADAMAISASCTEVGSGTTQPPALDDRQALALAALRRRLHGRIIALREDDAWFGFPRPLIDAVQEGHFPNLRFSACWTMGSTSCDTSPPKRKFGK